MAYIDGNEILFSSNVNITEGGCVKEYIPTGIYNKGDLVSYNGSLYTPIADGTSGKEPTDNPAWEDLTSGKVSNEEFAGAVAALHERIDKASNSAEGINDGAIGVQKLEGVSAITNLLSGTYTNKVMTANGLTYEDNANYRTWDNEIPCKQGDTLYRLNTGGISFICEYDASGKALNNGGNYRYAITAGVASTTIKHANTAFIRICEQKAVAEMQVWSKSPVSQYVESGKTLYDFTQNPMYADIVGKIGALPLTGKKIVNFGDSIFGNKRDTNNTTDKSISKMIAEKTGATVYNAGFGGCRMTKSDLSNSAFSMVQLAESIASGDWSAQDKIISLNLDYIPAYFSETVAMLKGIDFTDIDIVTISYGTNDYTANVYITGDEETAPTKQNYCFNDALRYSVEKLLTAFPHLKIFIISPMWRWFIENGKFSYDSDDEQSVNTIGYKLTDYVAACESVSKELHLPCLDTYFDLGINRYNYLRYFNATDGTHHNANGRELIAGYIASKLF